MICFYHDDLDGICAAWWVKYWCENNMNSNERMKFMAVNYGKNFPIDEITPCEKVFIVDFSLDDPEDMKKVLDITSNVVWIDHHISAINKYNNFDSVDGLRVNGVAACVLTYLFLFKHSDLTNYGDIPLFTRLIADHDIWRFKYGDNTRNFVAGLMCDNICPSSRIFYELEDSDKVQTIINNGRLIRKYIKNDNAKYATENAYEGEFEGYKALIINRGFSNSDLFDAVRSNKYDLYIKYCRTKEKKWTYTIYSDSVDVSKLAEKYGGGGHKGAAGFTTDTLIL